MNINTKEMQHMAQVMANERGLATQQVLFALERAVNKASKSDDNTPIDGHVASRQLSLQTKHLFMRELDGLTLEAKVAQILAQTVKLVTGVVRHVRPTHVKVEAEGFVFSLLREQFLPRDFFKIGDKVSFVPAIAKDQDGMITGLANRNSNAFIQECIKKEIIQIEEDDITIKKIVREPGKICQVALDGRMRNNAIAIAVGNKGAHIRSLTSELKGERIDFLLWDEDSLNRLVNGMQGVELVRVSLDEDTQEAVLVVTDDTVINDALKTQAKLAGNMAGMTTTIASESEMTARDNDDAEELNKVLVGILGAAAAEQLVESSFESIDDVAWRPAAEWPVELRAQAHEWAEKVRQSLETEQTKPLVQLGFSHDDALFLCEKNVHSVSDLADLATDELLELLPALEMSKASHMIMQARHLSQEFFQ